MAEIMIKGSAEENLVIHLKVITKAAITITIENIISLVSTRLHLLVSMKKEYKNFWEKKRGWEGMVCF